MDTVDFSDRNFSVKEAAEHLRISRAYLFKLLKEKQLRPVKLGTRTI